VAAGADASARDGDGRTAAELLLPTAPAELHRLLDSDATARLSDPEAPTDLRQRAVSAIDGRRQSSGGGGDGGGRNVRRGGAGWSRYREDSLVFDGGCEID
jgi:hypothetical protein